MNKITKDSQTNAPATLWCARHTQRWRWMSVLSCVFFFSLWSGWSDNLSMFFFCAIAKCHKGRKNAQMNDKSRNAYGGSMLLGAYLFSHVNLTGEQSACTHTNTSIYLYTYMYVMCAAIYPLDAATPCCMLLIACLRRHFIINQPPF